jgi:lipoprotein-anchoring transpeptidase ErfK/SrfK
MRGPAVVALALAGAALGAATLRADDGGSTAPARSAAAPARSAAPPAPAEWEAPRPVARAAAWPRAPHGVRVLRRTQLRDRPGGRVVAALGPRTGYGSDRVLAVVRRRPGWVAVLSQHVPNSRAGWIPAAAVRPVLLPYALDADLSARRILVRRAGRVVRRIRVAVGRPGAATPTGRFAVTDRLRITGPPSGYGCCALALTGRQPNVPQGWSGGDRLAIHGTPHEGTVGSAASAGCLRARTEDMRWLLARIPIGTVLRVRA